MNIYLFIIFLFALQIVCLVVGKLSSKKLDNKDDYFFAGKSVRFFPLMMTFLATQVGGGTILGAAEEAYRYGWSVIFYPLGQAIGLMVLGLGVGRKLAEFGVPTIAQIFDVVYKSPVLRRVASIFSIASLFLILIAIVVASRKFMLSLGVESLPLFIAFWAILIFYTVRGGLKAVIATDMVQAAFFFIVFLGCFLFYAPETISNLRFEDTEWIPSKISGWFLMPLCFMVIEQDMAQRCFAGGSARIISRASLWAGIAMIIVCMVPVIFGVAARSLDLPPLDGGSVLMAYVVQLTNPWISALVGCAVLAAILSTANSLINAISSNLSSDFALLRNQNVKWMTAIISVGALLLSYCFNNVVDMMILSYELSVVCLFVPIVAAIFKKQGNFLSAVLSIGGGALGYILCPSFALLVSAAGFGLGEITVWMKRRGVVNMNS